MQVNGKVRARITVPAGADAAAHEALGARGRADRRAARRRDGQEGRRRPRTHSSTSSYRRRRGSCARVLGRRRRRAGCDVPLSHRARGRYPTVSVGDARDQRDGLVHPRRDRHRRDRAALVVGGVDRDHGRLPGAYTTFSTFAWESFVMARTDRAGAATAYVVASVTLGLLGVERLRGRARSIVCGSSPGASPPCFIALGGVHAGSRSSRAVRARTRSVRRSSAAVASRSASGSGRGRGGAARRVRRLDPIRHQSRGRSRACRCSGAGHPGVDHDDRAARARARRRRGACAGRRRARQWRACARRARGRRAVRPTMPTSTASTSRRR